MSRPAAGFTLLEVLVALAVLGLAVVASIQGLAQGLRLLRLAVEHQQATLLADQKLREVGVPMAGHDSGTEGRFTWERTTSATGEPAAADVSGAWQLYTVTVRVAWDATRAVELVTLRAAPPPPADDEGAR